jgi:TusE/DsrC/DsvC family sulfur relay protein
LTDGIATVSEQDQFEDRGAAPGATDPSKIVLDGEGFLRNPSLWSEDVAAAMAKEAGVQSLSAKQWEVLRFIRAYYMEQGKAPLNHRIKAATGMSLQEIEALFPGGISKGARRLAGLPNARGCTAGSG